VAEYRAISAVRVRFSDRWGRSVGKLFYTVGEQRDGCMISAVFEPKRRFRIKGARIAFLREVSSPAETRKVLVEMVQQARSEV